MYFFLSVAEDKMGWHGKPLSKDMAESVIKELQSRIITCNKRLYPAPPIEDASPVSLRNIRMPSAPSYKQGDKVCSVLAKSHLGFKLNETLDKKKLTFFV